MKVLTHEGVVLTLPFTSSTVPDSEFERIDGNGSAAQPAPSRRAREHCRPTPRRESPNPPGPGPFFRQPLPSGSDRRRGAERSVQPLQAYKDGCPPRGPRSARASTADGRPA